MEKIQENKLHKTRGAFEPTCQHSEHNLCIISIISMFYIYCTLSWLLVVLWGTNVSIACVFFGSGFIFIFPTTNSNLLQHYIPSIHSLWFKKKKNVIMLLCTLVSIKGTFLLEALSGEILMGRSLYSSQAWMAFNTKTSAELKWMIYFLFVCALVFCSIWENHYFLSEIHKDLNMS